MKLDVICIDAPESENTGKADYTVTFSAWHNAWTMSMTLNDSFGGYFEQGKRYAIEFNQVKEDRA